MVPYFTSFFETDPSLRVVFQLQTLVPVVFISHINSITVIHSVIKFFLATVCNWMLPMRWGTVWQQFPSTGSTWGTFTGSLVIEGANKTPSAPQLTEGSVRSDHGDIRQLHPPRHRLFFPSPRDFHSLGGVSDGGLDVAPLF